MAYFCWNAENATSARPDDATPFKASDHTDAAEQFAQLMWDFASWSVSYVYADDEDGDIRLMHVERNTGFTAKPFKKPRAPRKGK